ncbi:MAG: LpxD N-terminal domain-containing protein, partial [Sulfurimicrobium sp.]|nr:LpxD N-terminal domain-containing protein [Sulfurimicrobium sp.]
MRAGLPAGFHQGQSVGVGMGHTYTLGEIVARLGGELLGDARLQIDQVAALEKAQQNNISFYATTRLKRQLDATQAGAVILNQEN